MNDNDLIECYKLIDKIITTTGYFDINDKIKWKVDYLNKFYLLEHNDILHMIFEEFTKKDIAKKINNKNTKLTTFIAHFTNYTLSTLIRRYEVFGRNYETIQFSQIKMDPLDKNIGYPESYLAKHLAKHGLEGIVDNTTPENNLIAKELWEMIVDVFDGDQLEALFEGVSRKEIADRLSLKYDTYCKRLNRRKDHLRELLTQNSFI